MELIELTLKSQQGDTDAFNEICQRFTGLVRKYANQAHVRAIRAEAEAEAWLAVAEAVLMYDEKSGVPVAGLIESKVKFAIWNMYKREKRRWQEEVFLGKDDEIDFMETLADKTDVAGEVELKLLGQDALLALRELPPKQQLAILRTVLNGVSLTETAREMGVTAQAVYNLRNRGLARLRKICSGMYRSEGGDKYGSCKNARIKQADI